MSNPSPANKGGSPQASDATYSEEWFAKGIYARHHLGRFEWLRRKFEALADAPEISVLEVGATTGAR
jgi:hypothetical protein